MKIRKGFSWLLVLVMLLAMIPPEEAHAATCKDPTGRVYSSHKWGKWTVLAEATCTEAGMEFRTCERCGQSEDRAIKPAHKYGKWKTTRAATCSKEGTRVRECTVCGHQQKGKIEKKSHAFGEWEVTRAATCKKTGLSTRTCKNCGAKETKSLPKNPKKHVWDKWKVTQQATCTKGGTEERVCKQCGKTDTRKTDPLGHKYGEWKITKPSVNGEPGTKERECERCHDKETGTFTAQGEAALTMTAGNVTRGEPSDGYKYVYNVPVTLTNTGTLALKVSIETVDDNGFLEVTNTTFGWDIEETRLVQPGESVNFVYQIRPADLFITGYYGMIRQYINASGYAEETGAWASASVPVVITLPAEKGLSLVWNDTKRTGDGEDETLLFNLTVTNVSEDWLHVTASADNEFGPLTEEEGFVGWPENGTLTLETGESYHFSYRLKPTHPDIDNSDYNGYCWLGREIIVADQIGHTASVSVAGWVNGLTAEPGQGFLEGDLQQHARGYIHEDEAFASRADMTLKNIGTTAIRDITVSGAMTDALGHTLHTYTLTPESAQPLEPNGTVPFTADLEISAADAAAAIQETDADGRHKIFFTFWATYAYDKADGETGYGKSNLWTGSITVGEGSVLNHGGIWPVLTGSFDDRLYQPGEKANIDLTLTNVSDKDTVEGVTFEYYVLGADGGEVGSPVVYELPDLLLMPGESYSLKNRFSYVFSEEDAEKGTVYLNFIAWCHSVEYDLNVNCSWHCDLRTEQKDALSVGVTVDTGEYEYFKQGTVDWHPVSPENVPGGTISAEVVVSNTSDQPVTAVVSSDHAGDKLDGEAEKTITLQPGEEQAVGLEITPTDEETEAGELHHVITAAADDTALSGSGMLDFVLYSGGWDVDKGIPGLTLTVEGVTSGWDAELNLRYWKASMNLANSGSFPLSLMADAVGAGSAESCNDMLAGWGAYADAGSFPAGESFDFDYYIYPTDDDVSKGAVHRTLSVMGFAEESDIVAADSASFTFGLEDMHLLVLTVDGEHRSGDEAQVITVDLTLLNQSNVPVTAGVSAQDPYGQPPAHDSFTGLPDTLTLDPGASFSFSYVIRPEAEEIESGEAIRTVTADGGDETLRTSVSLDLPLVPPESETPSLQLEGEITGTKTLTLNASFDVHLSAVNLGNVDLENVTFKGVAQAADGQCLASITLGAGDLVLEPGDGLQSFPSFVMTADMLTAALAAHGVNPGTVTFTYTAHYTARYKDGSCSAGVSNTVAYTLRIPNGLDQNGGITLFSNFNDCPASPKADEVVNIGLVMTNVGEEDLVGLKIDAFRAGPYGNSFLQTVMAAPLDIIHPSETRPCVFSYTLTAQDVEAGMLSFEFVASSESGSRPYVYVARYEWSRLIGEPEGETEEEKAENLQGGVLVTKSVISTSNDIAGYALGEQVAYEITVTNGHEDSADIILWDWIQGEEAPVKVAEFNLIPGGWDTEQVIHTVNEDDVANGHITNQAYASVLLHAEDPEKTVGYTAWAVPCTVDTIGSLPPPVKKDKEKEEEEKKDEKQEEKQEEKFEEPGPGVPVCRRVLPEGAEEYVLTFCEEHAPVNEQAEQLAAAGSHAEASALWEKNVNELYEDLQKQRPDAAEALAAERETFFAQVDAYRKLTATMYGADKAEQSVSGLLRDRCVDLCYALHHPQEPLTEILPDLILSNE